MPKPLATTIASLLTATAAFAQSPDERLRTSILDEVIVTATRTETDVFHAPYTAHVVTAEEFRDRRMVRSLPDALAETPGVLVQKTGYGQASPFIRGFTGFRTLALIDGIRLNNAVFREGPNQYWSTIDALTIDRLDVVKGPSSVLYGSDAIGGTVNALTRDPEMLPWPEVPQKSGDGKTALDGKAAKSVLNQPSQFALHGGAYYRYATAENSHIARGEFGLALTPHLGLLGGVTWSSFDDLRGGDVTGLQRKSGYDGINGDFKLLYRPTEDIDVTAAFYSTWMNNAPRWHATRYSTSFDGTALGTDLRREFDQLRQLSYVQAEIREAAQWLDKINVSLSWHRQWEEQDRIRDTGRRDITGFQDDTLGVQFALTSTTPLGTLVYGAEYYHDAIESWGTRWNADGSLNRNHKRGPVADESSYDLLGVYLQDTVKPWEPLEITMGVRYTWAEARAGVIDDNPDDDLDYGAIDKTFDAVTASIRARLDLARNWNLFGGVSQGFRAPNISDLTSLDIARSGELETPSPNLDAEQYTSFEIGTKARFDKLGLELYGAYFYTLVDNQIVRFPTGRTIDGSAEVTRANVGDGYIHGIELGAQWALPYGFTFFGNLTWTEGEIDTFVGRHITARPATRIQPLSGLAGLRWESSDRKWWAEATAQLARHQDRLSPGDMADTQRIPPGGTRGYQVFSLRLGYNPCEHLKFFAAVENIGDEDYRTLGSGLNEPGTNIVLGSQLKF